MHVGPTPAIRMPMPNSCPSKPHNSLLLKVSLWLYNIVTTKLHMLPTLAGPSQHNHAPEQLHRDQGSDAYIAVRVALKDQPFGEGKNMNAAQMQGPQSEFF